MTTAPQRHPTPEQLLEHLYGLLDPEDAARLETHLGTCPGCQEQQREARHTAGLLAEGARGEPVPLHLPPPRRGRRLMASGGLLAAAGLLAILCGHLLYEQAGSLAGPDVAGVSVTTLDSFEPGQPLAVEAGAYGPDGRPRRASLDATLTDDRGQVLYRAKLTGTTPATFELPPRMGRPSGELTLSVRTVAGAATHQVEVPLGRHSGRPMAHLQMDRTILRPGETLRFRAVVLDRLTLAPADGLVLLEILTPRGAPAQTAVCQLQQGVAAGEWQVTAGLPGGEYTLAVSGQPGQPGLALARAERRFIVRAYQLPRLEKEVTLDREAYAPGDRVEVSVSASRIEGGAAAGAWARASLQVEGEEIAALEGVLDAGGEGRFRLELPFPMERADATVVVTFTDGGVIETQVERIPVVLDRLDVAFFPEGGELVAGQAGRVYLLARDTLGRIAELAGALVDDQGREVARVVTDEDGRARCAFTPRPGRTYTLEIEEPVGIQPCPLPEVQPAGLTLRCLQDTYGAGEPITAEVAGASAGGHAALFCRGVLLDVVDLAAAEGPQRVTLDPGAGVQGVLRLTVLDADLRPGAERLTYRRSDRGLVVHLAPDQGRVEPGAHQALAISTTDERGEPVSAVVGLAVVDSATLELAGEEAPDLRQDLLLAGEVRDLEQAALADPRDAEEEQALDLLLGTQGWRRFVTYEGPPAPGALGDEDLQRDLEQLARAERGGDQEVERRSPGWALAQEQFRQERRTYRRSGRWLGLLGMLGVVLALLLLLTGATRALWHRRWLRLLPLLGLGLLVGGAVLLLVSLLTVLGQAKDRALPAAEAMPVAGLEDFPGGNVELVAELVADIEAAGVPQFALLPEPVLNFRVDAEAAVAFGFYHLPDLDVEIGEVGRPLFGAQGWRDGFGLRGWGCGVREYAHQRLAPAGGPQERQDFTEVVYWHPLLVTGADGSARVSFDCSDAVTSWEVRAEAHGGGRVGGGQATFQAVTPFHLEPVLPTALCSGDTMALPVSLVSQLDRELHLEVQLELGGGLTTTDALVAPVTLPPLGRTRILYRLEAGQEPGSGSVQLSAAGDGVADAVGRSIQILPRGFPVRAAHSGVAEGTTSFAVQLPADFDPRRARVSLELYPSTLATLEAGLEGILREPHGCFEQASSAAFPNVMVLNYLREFPGQAEQARGRARRLLADGYHRISGYECSRRGYEWFGGDPGHEALTAYGLLEFAAMQDAGHPVDGAMFERTKAWLLAQQEEAGGFRRNPQALDSFGSAPPETTDAYIFWALATVEGPEGREALAPTLEAMRELVQRTDDSYVIGLVARGALALGEKELAVGLAQRLAQVQAADGSVPGGKASITRSGRQDLLVETTALAVGAFLGVPGQEGAAERAVRWLQEQRQHGGGFGATQATILALQALVEHARTRRRPAAPGLVRARVDGHPVGQLDFTGEEARPLAFHHLAEHLEPGHHTITLELSEGHLFPYSFQLETWTDRPASAPGVAVDLEVALARDQVVEGDAVRLDATLRNRTGEGQPMTVAILGLPAGLECPTDQLQDLQETGQVDFFELTARGEIVLYWRDLAPEARQEIHLDLVARIPGRFAGPASRAYLYYTPQLQGWVDPVTVDILPR